MLLYSKFIVFAYFKEHVPVICMIGTSAIRKTSKDQIFLYAEEKKEKNKFCILLKFKWYIFLLYNCGNNVPLRLYLHELQLQYWMYHFVF